MRDKERQQQTEPIRIYTESEKAFRVAFNLPKVDSVLFLQYWVDRKSEGFDPETTQLGLIVTVESDDVILEGTLSKGEKALAVLAPYSKYISIVENPKVTRVELLDDQLTEILKSSTSDVVQIKAPWSGPVGDEWDSGAYDGFWHGAEVAFQKKIDTLNRVGKTVQVV